MPGEQEDDLEALMGKLGEFGKYQLFQFLPLLLAGVTGGINMLCLVTVAAIPTHRCAIPNLENASNTLLWNSSDVINQIPITSAGALSSCLLIDANTNTTRECNNWVFDNTYYTSTRATEWLFVCGQRWMGALVQCVYMLGVFVGSFTSGSMADKYGRKTIFYISSMAQLLFGVGIAFVHNYYVYLFVSFLYGFVGTAGSFLTAFVLIMELVGPSKRTLCGITYQTMFSLGIMIVAFWGYIIPDHFTLQVIYGIHSLFFIGHWWLIDESPRWLWSKGRIAEAVEVVARGVQINGGILIDKAYFVSRGVANFRQTEGPSSRITDLFKTPRIRRNTINFAICWFANSLAYYGLSLNTGNLQGNPYLILFIMGLVELPGYLASCLLLDRLGRRFITSGLMIIGGSSCLLTSILPPDSNLSLSVVFIGKMCIASSFSIIFNYSAELFPTVLRNSALGLFSMFSRISTILTPIISLLDKFDKRIPTVVFASVTLMSGLLTTFLPETLNKVLPQTIEDGENFGRGDTCFKTGCLPASKEKERRTL